MKALAVTHAGDADTLERLARFHNTGQRVLSVYINLDPRRFFTSDEPLAETIFPGAWGVAVVSDRGARLLRGGPGGLTEFASVTDLVPRRHAQDGWSHARFQPGIDERMAAHVRGVADRLLRAHRRSPFAHLVVACPIELRAMVAHSLDGELKSMLVGIIDRDLEHGAVDHIAGIVAPLIERAERERESELVTRVEEELGTRGPVAAGLDEVLATLEQQRVAVLLVSDRGLLQAGRCPTCGRLSTDGGRTCALDGASLARVDARICRRGGGKPGCAGGGRPRPPRVAAQPRRDRRATALVSPL